MSAGLFKTQKRSCASAVDARESHPLKWTARKLRSTAGSESQAWVAHLSGGSLSLHFTSFRVFTAILNSVTGDQYPQVFERPRLRDELSCPTLEIYPEWHLF